MPAYTDEYDQCSVLPIQEQLNQLDINESSERKVYRRHAFEAEERTVVDPLFLTQYQIKVKENEFPVIGTFVDERITPGFFYRVKRIATDSYFWNGEAKQLVSVGMGYGKRITFKADRIGHHEDFYFYSDTETEGFAFIPAIPETQNKFTLCDEDGRQVAEVKVTSVNQEQVQITSECNGADIENRIFCCFTCDIHSLSVRGGIIPLNTSLFNCGLQGVGILERKSRPSNAAALVRIDNVFVPPFGVCYMVPN